MANYKTIITNHALTSLSNIKNYIAFTLGNPTAAFNHLKLFQAEIEKLALNPQIYRPIDIQPWHDEGIRRVSVKNYYLYYWIDTESHTVYITEVLYAGSNQPRWLQDMSMI